MMLGEAVVGDQYFSDGQDLVTLRMFDVMPSIERWTFAAEHGFDLCAEMGSWVPDVERLGETGLCPHRPVPRVRGRWP
jgi:5-methylthioadenosine/S-adenosylhomocysteine deaminase